MVIKSYDLALRWILTLLRTLNVVWSNVWELTICPVRAFSVAVARIAVAPIFPYTKVGCSTTLELESNNTLN